MNPDGTIYQDGESPDSLAAALRMWLELLSSETSRRDQQLTFTFACQGESRALRVAGYLRRRLQCVSANVYRIDGGERDEWHIEGTTRSETQSLSDLERLFAWIGGTAARHQIQLRGIGIRPPERN